MLVEQDSEVRVASVGPELIRDVQNMIAGFLKNNRMELPTGCRSNVSRIFARRAWVPLKKGKAELMMHEIAVGLDCPNLTMGRTNARGLGEGPVPARGLELTGLCVPARAVLALLLQVGAERTGCVPTWWY